MFDESPLHCASDFGYSEIVQLLVDNKAALDEYNDDQFTPLLLAVLEDHHSVCKILVDAKADINKVGRYLLLTTLKSFQSGIF